MRKTVFAVSITAAILLLAAVHFRLPTSADAAPQVRGATDAYAVEATIDVKALPRQDMLSEADE
jgi:hypothetical protein